MFTQIITRGRFYAPLTAVVLFLALFAPAHAQSTTTLQGRVVDPKGAAVPGVKVTARSQATGVERVAQTDTRFPTGESGSSRQVQFAMKMMF